MVLVIAYWTIRGLIEPIRLLLEFSGLPYREELYDCGPAPTYDRSSWTSVKPTLGLPFPNLPYLVDENETDPIRVVQSNAILRYIARKADLLGHTESERTRIDIMVEQTTDLRNGWVRLCYNPSFDDLKDAYIAGLPAQMAGFEAFLGDHPFFAGENVTLADFHFFEMLQQHLLLVPGLLEAFPHLEAFRQRFLNLPQIQAYYKSDRFKNFPLNNKMAKFGSVAQ